LKTKKLIIKFTVFILVFSGMLFAKTNKECRKVPVVMIEKMVGEDFKIFKDFRGTTEAKTKEILSPLPGKVTELKISEGDLITKGWIIAIINDALSEEIEEIKTNLEKWEQILWNREHWKVRSEAAEAQAKRKIKEFKEQLEEKKKEAEKYKVKSTISGVVDKIMVEEGKEVEENSILAKIINKEILFAEIKISSQEKALFSQGDSIKATANVNGNEDTVTADVIKVNDNKAVLKLDNRDRRIKESSEIHFKLLFKEYNNAVFLSPSLMLSDETEGKFFVYTPVYFEDRIEAKKTYITVGQKRKGKYFVKKGLKPGDGVIKTELECLEDGKIIKILYRSAETGRYMLKEKGEKIEISEVEKVKKPVKEKKKEVREKKKKKVEKPEKKVKKKEEKEKIKEEKEIKEKPENKFAIKIFQGLSLAKSKEISEINTFLASRNISPESTEKKVFFPTGIGFSYIINDKLSVGITGSYLFRKHDFSGSYSQQINSGTDLEYEYDTFNINEKYILIKTKLNYLIWSNNKNLDLELGAGFGMYFGSFDKDQSLSLSISQDSTSMTFKDYEETSKANSSGFLLSLNGNLNYNVSSHFSFFVSLGTDYLLSSKWKGDSSYKLPEQRTVSGELYYVDYNEEKYLWILDPEQFEELNSDENYTLEKPDFISGSPYLRFNLGITYKF